MCLRMHTEASIILTWWKKTLKNRALLLLGTHPWTICLIPNNLLEYGGKKERRNSTFKSMCSQFPQTPFLAPSMSFCPMPGESVKADARMEKAVSLLILKRLLKIL